MSLPAGGAEHLRLVEEILIRRRDTHLDSLLDRLREKRVRRVLEPPMAQRCSRPTIDHAGRTITVVRL